MSTRLNGHPSQAVDVEALCLSYVGVTPDFDPKYDRLQVRMPERVQSRIDKNNAPDFQVKRYAAQMSESKFPAPLLTKDHIPVDGNTRIRAHGVRNERYIEALVLPISWDEADPAIKNKLGLLSLALNAMNGLPLDEEERLRYADKLIDDNASDEEIVGKTGVAMSKITSLRHQKLAVDRLKRLGITVKKDELPDTTLRAFGKPTVMRLDDEAFKDVVGLTKDAGLKGQAVSGIATSLGEQPSQEARRERIARERKALEPQIMARQHGQDHPMQTTRLRRALELMRDHPVTSFVEGDAEKFAEYLELIDKGIEKLTELRTLQLSQPQIATQARATSTSVQ